MSDDTFMKKIARELAESAIGGEKQADLQGVLSNPYLQNALLGAGAGGLVGLATGKNKRRAALDYALMGGIGGLGATAAKQMLTTPAAPPAAIANAVGEDGSALGPAVGLGAMGAGALGGHKLHNVIDQYGKLDRMMDMRSNKTVADALRPVRDALDGARPGGVDFALFDALEQGANRAPGLRGKAYGFLKNIHRWGRPSNAFGGNTVDATNLLAQAAKHKGGSNITGSAIRAALARTPKVRGRFALPIMGALAVPALWNTLTAPKAE